MSTTINYYFILILIFSSSCAAPIEEDQRDRAAQEEGHQDQEKFATELPVFESTQYLNRYAVETCSSRKVDRPDSFMSRSLFYPHPSLDADIARMNLWRLYSTDTMPNVINTGIDGLVILSEPNCMFAGGTISNILDDYAVEVVTDSISIAELLRAVFTPINRNPPPSSRFVVSPRYVSSPQEVEYLKEDIGPVDTRGMTVRESLLFAIKSSSVQGITFAFTNAPYEEETAYSLTLYFPAYPEGFRSARPIRSEKNNLNPYYFVSRE